jgi:hypothetical protein
MAYFDSVVSSILVRVAEREFGGCKEGEEREEEKARKAQF